MADEKQLSEVEALCERAVALIGGVCPEGVLGSEISYGQVSLRIDAARIVEVCVLLRDAPELRFDFLCDVTAIDWMSQGRQPRFEVVYHLLSTRHYHRLRLKCDVAEDTPEIDSVYSVWSGANWPERETFDLFGIVFRGHPDLRRIMMPDDWEGHPLRKDFPMGGVKSFYFKRESHPHVGEPEGLVPRIRVQTGDV